MEYLRKKTFILSLLVFSSVTNAQSYQRPFEKYNQLALSEFWRNIDDIFNDPNFSGSNWGVVIRSLDTGEDFYKRNEDKLFIPASNLKLFTTAAALYQLGENYTFKTNIYANGTVDGTILQGDLVIQGFGDPTISGRFTQGDIYKIYNDWADSILALGIDEISGNLIGDDNAFEDIGLGPGWAWDDESFWYSAPTSAISFNDNCVEITVRPTTSGMPAQISVLPETKYVTIVNKVTTVDNNNISEIEVQRERGTNVITVFGKIAENSEEKKTFSTVNNPTQFSMVVLKEVLHKKGIDVKGYAADIDDESKFYDYASMVKIFTHQSVPLFQILNVINKMSINFYAEQLFKTMGYERFGFGSMENGNKAVKSILKEMGINPENMIMADGSGLSRLNLVTPKQIVALLTYIFKSETYKTFYESLPISGIDGTLARRMVKTKAENNVHAKTGYIGGIRSLSGYMRTADNEPVVFSIIVNNYIVPSTLADNIQDLVCLRLANFSRKN